METNKDINVSVGMEIAIKRTEKQIIASLREFTEKLEGVEDLEITEVQKVETPDGPMHLRRKKTWRRNGVPFREDMQSED